MIEIEDWEGMIAMVMLLPFINVPLYFLIAKLVYGDDPNSPANHGLYGVWEIISTIIFPPGLIFHWFFGFMRARYDVRENQAEYSIILLLMLWIGEFCGLYLLGVHHWLAELVRSLAPYLESPAS